jgi:hypothetical protein
MNEQQGKLSQINNVFRRRDDEVRKKAIFILQDSCKTSSPEIALIRGFLPKRKKDASNS